MPSPRRSADTPLARYREKRNFERTPEPAPPEGHRKSANGGGARAKAPPATLAFVIQKHWASRLHYDFRLELDGVLLSWAVPKGPSFDPKEKRMAIEVEDHPLEYGTFEGTIPAKQYGAGKVIVWDQGTWAPVGDPREGKALGKIIFSLHGQKLAGLWELVRISKPGEKKQPEWFLFKKRDAWARPLAEYDVIAALPDSIVDAPLGLVEEREPRTESSAGAALSAPTGPVRAPDLALLPKLDRLPEKLEPQLATLAAAPPERGQWVVETKFDGYRILARVERGQVQLFTRNGNNWTEKLRPLARDIGSLQLSFTWLDGEIVVLNAQGLPDFNALQNAMDGARNADIVYFVFDAPFFEGHDLRSLPVVSRRALLEQFFEKQSGERVRFSAAFDVPPARMLEAACKMQLEGVMLKRSDAPYVSARTDTWLKLKCTLRQELVVLGFTARAGARGEVGGMLLGYHDEAGKLRYAGSVGTGWDAKTGRELFARLQRIETKTPPLDALSVKPGRWSRRAVGTERWVRPELVAEVAFTEWTPDGHVRHPSFKRLRTDKPASAVRRESTPLGPVNEPPGPTSSPSKGKKQRSSVAATTSTTMALVVKVTHGERVIDSSTGLKKLDLVRYYESVAEWMLPHLAGRPVSLVRAPMGIGGQMFFQKHPETRMPGLTELDPKLWPGHGALLAVDDAQALIAAAQMNVVEFHTWNSTIKRIDQPDRVIFDLDPGEGVSWTHLKEAAVLTRAMLEELGLASWLKTSGGKGLHVVVPLTPKLDYESVKAFSQDVVRHMAKTIPERFVAKAGGGNRVGRIFVDYLRNGHSQTTAAAFSARARPGLGVSMPIAWEDLNGLKSASQWTIATAREHLSFQRTDPWLAYWTHKQTLAQAIKRLGHSSTG